MYIIPRLSGFAVCSRECVLLTALSWEVPCQRVSKRMWTCELEVSKSRAKPIMMGFLEGSYLLSALSCFVFITQRVSAV